MDASEILEKKINDVLAEWNPIKVPESIADIEYTSYVGQIVISFIQSESIFDYLVYIYTNVMGYEMNEASQRGIELVSNKILHILDPAKYKKPQPFG